jgi:sugar (pentulose or hexulose) kinase
MSQLLMLAASSFTPAPTRSLAKITGNECALGFDFGTSGVRCAVVDAAGSVVASPEGFSWGARERSQSAADWEEALVAQLDALPIETRRRIQRIAFSGTSGSMLLVDAEGAPAAGRGAPRMYDFSVAKQASGDSGAAALQLLNECAPAGHTVRSATSALAKLLAYHFEAPLAKGERLAHQADYCASLLTGAAPSSDWHNALKLGFDVRALAYPEWMTSGPIGEVVGGRLPTVVQPGEYALPPNACRVYARSGGARNSARRSPPCAGRSRPYRRRWRRGMGCPRVASW